MLAALLVCLVALVAGARVGPARAGSIVCFVDAQHGWQSIWDGSYGASSRATAFRTIDGGATWTESGTGSAAFTSGGVWGGGFFAFASRTTGIWVRASRTVLRTTNAGVSWHSVRVAQPGHWLNDASFATSRIGWACSELGSAGERGSIAKTTNAGATWRIQKRFAVSHGSYFLRVSCPNARTCFVLGMDTKGQCVWATADGGKHWTRRRLPGGTYWTSFDFPTATTGWAVGQGDSNGSVIRTRNGGRTWNYYRSGIAFLGISFCNPEVGFAVGAYGMVSRTTNGGSKWTDLEGPDPNGADLSEVTCVDATHVWVTDVNGTTYVSADGGNTWNWNSVYPPSNDGE